MGKRDERPRSRYSLGGWGVLSDLHMWAGIAVLATNAAAALVGGSVWLRGTTWLGGHPAVAFWYVLRVAQATVVVQVALGLALLASGRRTGDDLHVLYGLAPLVVSLVTEAMRVGAAGRELAGVEDLETLERAEQARIARRVVLRETGIMAVGCLLIVTLALRAATTGGA
jgi:hypothetical protein